jgi:ABC-type dipeptide/oligopeptide/nickel transport system permease subunit
MLDCWSCVLGWCALLVGWLVGLLVGLLVGWFVGLLVRVLLSGWCG